MGARCRIILGLLIAMWASAPQAAAAGDDLIRLRPSVTIHATVVLLNDLAENAPSSLGALRLFPGPPWGGEKVVTAAQVRHRLAVLTGRPFGTTGAGEVRIRSLGGDRTNEVRERFERELASRAAAADGMIFEPKFPSRPVLLPDGPLNVVFQLPGRDHGVGVIRVALEVAGKTVKTIAVPCRVARRMSVPVATRELSAGDTLVASDVVWVERRIGRRLRQPFTPGTNFIGYRVTRRLRKGEILNGRSLEPKPAVYRGESIDLVVRRSNITVTGRAKALQDGWIGSRIRVKNLITNRLVYGRVTAKGVVLYE